MRNSYATFAMLWKWYNTWKSIFEISIFLENRTLICQCGCSMVHKSHNNRWQILRNVFRKIDFWSISRAPIILKNPKTPRAGRSADNFLFLRKMLGPREKLQKSILIQKFFFQGWHYLVWWLYAIIYIILQWIVWFFEKIIFFRT